MTCREKREKEELKETQQRRRREKKGGRGRGRGEWPADSFLSLTSSTIIDAVYRGMKGGGGEAYQKGGIAGRTYRKEKGEGEREGVVPSSFLFKNFFQVSEGKRGGGVEEKRQQNGGCSRITHLSLLFTSAREGGKKEED